MFKLRPNRLIGVRPEARRPTTGASVEPSVTDVAERRRTLLAAVGLGRRTAIGCALRRAATACTRREFAPGGSRWSGARDRGMLRRTAVAHALRCEPLVQAVSGSRLWTAPWVRRGSRRSAPQRSGDRCSRTMLSRPPVSLHAHEAIGNWAVCAVWFRCSHNCSQVSRALRPSHPYLDSKNSADIWLKDCANCSVPLAIGRRRTACRLCGRSRARWPSIHDHAIQL